MMLANNGCTSSPEIEINGDSLSICSALSARQCQKGTTPVNGACAADASCVRVTACCALK